VKAVHVGIGHDDDLVIAHLADVVISLADPRSQGGNNDPDLLALEHLVETGLLDVEDLAAEREDRLKFPVSSLLGRTTGRIPFDQVQFTARWVLLLAVRQFTRQ